MNTDIEFSFSRILQLTRVHAREEGDYDGLTLTVVRVNRDNVRTAEHLYLESTEQLDTLLLSLIQARIDWDA